MATSNSRPANKMSSMNQNSDKENNVTAHSVNRGGRASATPLMTPSKSRYSLGSASKYYFKYMNSTGKKKNKNDLSIQEDDPNYYFNYMNSTGKKSRGDMSVQEDDTGTISIPGVHLNTSSLDASLLSIGASSSSSEESDLLNKSTLSDTTELTASNFVLAATSRQKMRQLSVANLKPNPKQAPLKPESSGVASPVASPVPLSQESSKHSVESSKTSPVQGGHSIQGASPSLRSRISASPKSLRKFTEDLKSSRIKRQAQREENAKRRLSSDSGMMKAMNEAPETEHTVGSRMRLPPSFLQPSSDNKRESILSTDTGSTTDEIMGAMDELFGMINGTVEVAVHSQGPRQPSIAARLSEVNELMEATASVVEVPSTVAFTQQQQQSPITEQIDLKTFASPEQKKLSSTLKLTPSGRKARATPTKLAATPQRIENPRLFDSPARNTRSAKKEKMEAHHDETASIADIANILGGALSMELDISTESNDKYPPMLDGDRTQYSMGSGKGDDRSVSEKSGDGEETASIGDIGGILGSLTQESGQVSSPPQPQRVVNPRITNSPARNTRSAKKAPSEQKVASAERPSVQESKASFQGVADVAGSQRPDRADDLIDPSSTDSNDNLLSSEREDPNNDLNLTSRSGLATCSTPTKLPPTPQRIENPRLMDSPARNTRSARKEWGELSEAETASLGDIQIILDEAKAMDIDASPLKRNRPLAMVDRDMNQQVHGSGGKIEHGVDEKIVGGDETASIGDIGDFLSSLTQYSEEIVPPPKQRLSDPENLDSSTQTTDGVSKVDSSSKSFFLHERKSVEMPTSFDEPGVAPASQEPVADLLSMESMSQSIPSPANEVPSLLDGEVGKAEENALYDETASIEDLADILGSQRSRETQSVSSMEGQVMNGSPQPMMKPRALDSPARNTRSASKMRGYRSAETDDKSLKELIDDEAALRGDHVDAIGPASTQTVASIMSSKKRASSISTVKSTGSEEKLVISKVDTSGDDTASIADIADILGTATSMHDVETSPLRNSPSSIQNLFPTGSPEDSAEMDLSQRSFGSERKDGLSQIESNGEETASISDLADLLGKPQSMLDDSSASYSNQDDKSPMTKNLGHPSRNEPMSEHNDITESFRNEHLEQSPMSHASFNDPKESSSTPQKVHFPKSPMRLAPNSHVKPTPTKIQPSPRRVPNPQAVQSPARSTRSAMKAGKEIVATSAQKRRRNPENSTLSTYSDNHVLLDTKSETRSHKRQKFTNAPIDKENHSLQSPMPKKFQPVGILSSKKRIRNKTDTVLSQRSVAFGSPEAALYHVGSPSGNFTPLPRSRAKELFAMPTENAAADQPPLHTSAEGTVEIETDLNILVDKITVANMRSSPALSPIANDRDASRIDESYDFSMAESANTTASNADMSKRGDYPQNENTVELENGIEHLLANAMHSSQKSSFLNVSTLSTAARTRNGPSTAEESSPADSSVDMTDNQSIASINSRAEKYTAELSIPPMDAQKLDFSFQSTNDIGRNEESMDIDEGNTVELEGDITSLLAAAGQRPLRRQHTIESPGDIAMLSQASSTTSSPNGRTPVASIRFSLSPGKMLKPSAVDSLLMADSFDETVSIATEGPPEDPFTTVGMEDPVTLTLDEIRATVGLTPESAVVGERRKEDSLTSFNQSLQRTDSITFERWNQFLQAVCGEVEKQQTDLDGTASAAFSVMVESQPEFLVKLQAKLRSSDTGKMQQDMQMMVHVGKQRIEAEWQNWLAIVLESFKNPLSAVTSGLRQEKDTMDRASEKFVILRTKLSFMAGKKVQRARRKSLSRRKVRHFCFRFS